VCVNMSAFPRSSTHATPPETVGVPPTYLPTRLQGRRLSPLYPPAIRRSPRISATTAVRTAVASSPQRLKTASLQPVADATHLEAT
jgi:hypothetical protein